MIWTGPWIRAFGCPIPFAIHSKSNFRRGGASSSTAWRDEQAFRSQLAALVGSALPAGWDPGDRAVPLAARPVFAVAIVAISRLDTANLSKSILDALEGLVFINDAQVRYQVATSERRGDPRGLVAVAALDPGVTPAELAKAGSALLDAALAAFTAP